MICSTKWGHICGGKIQIIKKAFLKKSDWQLPYVVLPKIPVAKLAYLSPETCAVIYLALNDKYSKNSTNEPLCQFLDSAADRWSGEGCRRVEEQSNSSVTVCSCNHLTNFALLMSTHKPSGRLAEVLSIFTIVGCAVSTFFLLVTLVIYCILWKHLTNDRNGIGSTRSKLLVNLCVILVIAYVTFLAGVGQREHQDGCRAVAVILHYVWLVAFFLMLSEGVHIFVSVVIVFSQKSIFKWLMLMSYGVPAIIVAVTLAVVKLEGYGGPDSCWLSPEKDVLWAFVGPALLTLVANFIFVALVIRAMLMSKTLQTKSKLDQTKTFVRAICVMSPVLGLTWVFGVMGVSEETMVFQVLFVLFNSLQGLLIFVFHCLLAKAVRDGLLMKSKNYRLSKLSTTSANKSVFDKYKYSQDSTSSINSELTSSSGAGLPDKTKAVSRQKQNILPSSGSFFRSRPDPYTQPYYFNCSTL